MISNPVGLCFRVVGGARPPHCVRCGQPIQRKRKTAIYCSGNCREKTSIFERRSAVGSAHRSRRPTSPMRRASLMPLTSITGN
jgi:hypothetical protein